MKKLLLLISFVLILFPLIGQTFGNAINMDGIDDCVEALHDPSLNPLEGSWTILFWLKAPDIIQKGPLVRKRFPDGGYNQYNLNIANDDPHILEPGKRINVDYIEDDGVSERSGYCTEEFVDGNWHHIAFVANYATDSVYIFIDGIKQAFDIKYNFGDWPNVENEENLMIGRNNSGGSFLLGTMDELSIWNKALSLANIQEMMYDTLSSEYYTTSDSGLIAYYRFDEFEDLGIGNSGNDDFRDLSVWGNHADSEGNPELIPSDFPVNIDYKKVSDFMTIYPNPAKNKFEVRSSIFEVEGCKIELYDLFGKLVAILSEGNSTTNQMEFNVSNMPQGIYLLRATTENKSITKRLILIN